MHETIIRAPGEADHDAWLALWQGYIRFYRGAVAGEATAATWRRLLTPGDTVWGRVAERDGRVIGLVHCVDHASTWSVSPICYLQDLFVEPQARGGGAARALMDAAFEVARQKGAFRVYWQTQEYNAPARSLYDTIVPRSSFIVYRKPLN